MRTNFKTRNLIVSSPGRPKKSRYDGTVEKNPQILKDGKAKWRKTNPNPKKKNRQPSEILKDQWNDGKSPDIV